MNIQFCILVLFITWSLGTIAAGQEKPATTKPVAPVDLPGKGLAQHDFFYAGESRDRRMFIVKNGQMPIAA